MNKAFPVISIILLITAGYELLKINTLTEENSSLKAKVVNSAQSGCDVCTPSQTASVFTMTPSTLKTMRTAYTGNRPTASGDATSIWFPLEDIKNFILEVQKDTCGKSCNDTLGIRIYYARYPSSLNSFPDLVGLDTGYSGKHTLFMVPTYNAQGHHIDFNPLDPAIKGCSKPAINADATNTSILVFSAKNHGELCPPVCSPTPPTGYAAFY